MCQHLPGVMDYDVAQLLTALQQQMNQIHYEIQQTGNELLELKVRIMAMYVPKNPTQCTATVLLTRLLK